MDARYYNGDPDNHPRLHGEGRREEPEAAPLRFICHRCSGDVFSVYSLADVGVFCSAACREAWTVPAHQRGAA